MKRTLSLLTVLFCALPLIMAAQDAPLDTRINHLKNHIAKEESKLASLNHKLGSLEKNIGHRKQQLQQVNQTLAEETQQLATLKQTQAETEKRLQRTRQFLADQIRASYLMGKQSYLKLLLSQQQPAKTSRMLAYYHYFTAAHLRLIETMQQDLKTLQENEASILSKQQHMTKLKQQRQTQLEVLTGQQQHRKKLVRSLHRNIKNQQQQLNILRADRRKLSQITHELGKKPAAKHPYHDFLPFSSLAGKLPWPTTGRIQTHFGKAIEHSELKQNGVTIAAPAAQAVRAVYPGKVVFANWLRGFGLLIIIDHGDGYMSLYGHNQSLNKHINDLVQAGEEIATVGRSGGYTRDGLYFEIRHNGQPLNPEKWCRRKKGFKNHKSIT